MVGMWHMCFYNKAWETNWSQCESPLSNVLKKERKKKKEMEGTRTKKKKNNPQKNSHSVTLNQKASSIFRHIITFREKLASLSGMKIKQYSVAGLFFWGYSISVGHGQSKPIILARFVGHSDCTGLWLIVLIGEFEDDGMMGRGPDKHSPRKAWTCWFWKKKKE